MAAYLIYQGEVVDPELYEEYKAGATASVEEAGGRYLVRGGDVEVLGGEPPAGRTVVIEFPSMQHARAWFDGPAYRAVRPLRERAARTFALYFVEGAPPA